MTLSIETIANKKKGSFSIESMWLDLNDLYIVALHWSSIGSVYCFSFVNLLNDFHICIYFSSNNCFVVRKIKTNKHTSHTFIATNHTSTLIDVSPMFMLLIELNVSVAIPTCTEMIEYMSALFHPVPRPPFSPIYPSVLHVLS